MKQSQWTIAVIVLAALVFVVTFAMNYIGGGRPPSGQKGPVEGEDDGLKALVFAQDNFRQEGEEKVPGYADFWFTNPNDKEVTLGLDKGNCRCTSVEVFLLPETRRPSVPIVGPTIAGAVCPGNPATAFQALFGLTVVPLAVAHLQEQISGDELVRPSGYGSTTVPASAVGWVRLNWHGERAGPHNHGVKLLQGLKLLKLDAGTLLHTGVRYSPKIGFGVLREEHLKGKGRTRNIIVWSSTRRQLHLEQEESSPSDPVKVGEPERLSVSEIERLQERHDALSKDDPAFFGRILCAYRIPVTLLAESSNGTPFDLGSFQRRIPIKCKELPDPERAVLVTGWLRGIVEIGSDEGTGSEIDFGTFASESGATRRITLYTEDPDLTLDFDSKRTPAFLKAVVTRQKKDGETGQSWTLEARVVSGESPGRFPLRENGTEDSAIYLIARFNDKTAKAPRHLRIPARGTPLGF